MSPLFELIDHVLSISEYVLEKILVAFSFDEKTADFLLPLL